METKNSEHKEGRSYDMLVPPELLERKKREKKKERESQELMTEERHSELTGNEY